MPRESFHQELDQLQQKLILMGERVQELIVQATDSLARRDLVLAEQVIDHDDEVDALLMDVEQRSLRLLALQQPMAVDLRVIGTALKISTDLERMADHAVDIARVNLRIGDEPLIKELVDIPKMADLTRQMIGEAIACYLERDDQRARRMIALDDEVDHLYSHVFQDVLNLMAQRPESVKQLTYLLHTALYLERVADHATNLGEWIIYMVTGKREELNK